MTTPPNRRSPTGRPGTSARATPALPPDWDALIKEAERRGYIEFHNNRVRYKCAQMHEEVWSDPEERVRAGVYSWLIIDKEYPAASIKVEAIIPRRTPSDYADIVVYTDSDCRAPFLVVETKEPRASQAEFRQAIEQAFGNANSLRDTKLAMVDCGTRSALYAVAGYPHDERRENLLGTRDDLPKSYGTISQFGIVAGDPHCDIQPRPGREVEQLVRRAHGLIWAGGKRDPLTAFDEWSKLLFAKVYDERHTANGEPRRFQVGRREADVSVGNRIRDLYIEAQREDPSIFSDAIDLPDEKIVQVVRVIQPIAFTQMDLDTLGSAFEGFFGAIFRGELGQYFTRREIVRFVCAMLDPTDRDKVLDPTAGSGGFLLETLIQVWHRIDNAYRGQPDQERRKYDFAHNSLYGIEIHVKLGRICQTNLMLHKDGHTNIEVDRSCLDSTFRNPFLDPNSPRFSLVVGNPPFGDEVREGDRDLLGSNRLSNFEVAADGNSVSSELVILERAIKWLVPGAGRLGMVVPDGVLNNSGEISRCPAFRRLLFRNTQLLAIVSLPDYAFRKSGAQNKTSLLFLRRLSDPEKVSVEAAIERHLRELARDDPDAQEEAIGLALAELDYPVFLAEAEQIGFTAAGTSNVVNDLYRKAAGHLEAPGDTILGQYRRFKANPHAYDGNKMPPCLGILVSDLYKVHSTHRIDPKYHIFKHVEEVEAPTGLSVYALGELLERRVETVVPSDFPNREFITITLTQDGTLETREPGKGKCPPDWHGVYFAEGQKWFVVREGGILYSRIDLWKGCIGVIGPAFDGAVVTGEFPVYYVREDQESAVDLRYLQLLLRTSYFQRALRAINTGHSNRRRTQDTDFEALKVFLPEKPVQEQVVAVIAGLERQVDARRENLQKKLTALDEIMLSRMTPDRLSALLAE